MEKQGSRKNFRLQVPLDASEIEGFTPDRPVKVVIQGSDGTTSSQIVRLDKGGQGRATFTFLEHPGALRIVVGPEDASDEELLGMQTLGLEVPARDWRDRLELALPPIRIPAYYWRWWLWWCRTFVIEGRVLCADGSPVPGATVCAYDVDFWWWWGSYQQVGCATTDASGTFAVTFRWCCGWWPWWWWQHRFWSLEPILAERIMPVLQRELMLQSPPAPSPQPDLAIFERLLEQNDLVPPQLQPTRPTTGRPMSKAASVIARVKEQAAGQLLGAQVAFNPALLDALGERLRERLPLVPELERLHLWPWWRWQPWWDCTPDIIFRVTQDCQGQETVIVNEGYWDTRWDIPTNLNVTLVASNQACCIEPDDGPEGNCMVITQACSTMVYDIGGNPGAAAAPPGYVNPGVIATLGDRPFAGTIPISGVFGDGAGVDYYEFEWSTTPGGPWTAMPPLAVTGFARGYWGPVLPAGPIGFHSASFPVTNVSGRNVVESRQHFEANNGPGTWGLTRFWTYNRDELIVWLTENTFADGTYYLRVTGWDLAGGNLVNPRVLPLCDTNDDNGIVLTIDNRIAPGPGAGHPTTPDHLCGTGTVHTCTTEPDTDFIAVSIDGAPVAACAVIDAKAGGQLEIDFLAHDPDGHLAYYSLQATYGENLAVDLLGLPSATLTPLTAAQVGPTYADARAQGAVAPTWHGGTFRLTVTNLAEAFPKTCCYQLELRAYKRNIVSCDGGLPFNNLSEYSLTVVV